GARVKWSTPAKLTLVMLLVAAPPAIEGFLAASRERDEARDEARDATEDLLAQAAQEHATRIQGAQALLTAAVHAASVQAFTEDDCDAYLARLMAAAPRYANLGVADAAGQVHCSAVPSATISIADRSYFQQALATGRFTIGDFQVGRITGKPVQPLALVLPGSPTPGVAFAALDLAWLSDQLVLPGPGAVVVMADQDGLILARQPDAESYVGRRMMGNGTIVDEMLERREGDVVAPGIDGVERYYRFTTIQSNGSGAILVAAGVPTANMYAEADAEFQRALWFLAASVVLAVILGFLVGTRMLGRPLRNIQEAARRLRRRDFKTRVEAGPGLAELQELAATLDEMARELARLDDARRRLLNSTAHELYTPLTSIILALEVLRREASEAHDEAGLRRVESLQRNARRMEHIVQDAQLAVRLEAGEVQALQQDVDLRALVQATANHPRVRLELQPVTAVGDERHIRDIVDRLVRNALQFSQGDLHVAVRRDDSVAAVMVRDEGRGIDPERQARLFQPLGDPAEDGGVGTGLYICRELARLMGGDLRLESPGVGKGTVATLQLPAKRP
ncbi:MAG TPA: ATP-binding protein, partial [Candidatus Thermoplasmatota archaeon]|nr:ATP-binding protein [Candidatus Thermoplasmatota archaeon]